MSSSQFPGPLQTGSLPPTYSPLNNTSNLLFGFLVSALSIFAVFIVSVLVWNRLVARRRAIEATLVVSAPPGPSRQVHRPAMWDVWAVPDKQLPGWLNVKPVAAQMCDLPAGSSRPSHAEQGRSFRRCHLSNKVPPEIAYLFYRPTPRAPPASSDADIDLPHGSDVEISLLISMPHAPQTTQEGKGPKFHELVFATTNVHYHDPSLT